MRQAWISAAGRRATMPTVMISDMPLPTPRSVIWSPSHIRNIVPAVSVITVMIRNAIPGSDTSGMSILLIVSMIPWRKGFDPGILESQRQQVALKDAQRDRRIARVLHDLLPPAVLLGQLAELRNHRRQQLQHDRGADVGHHAQRKDRAVFQRAAAEDIEERRDVAAGLVADLRVRTTPG